MRERNGYYFNSLQMRNLGILSCGGQFVISSVHAASVHAVKVEFVIGGAEPHRAVYIISVIFDPLLFEALKSVGGGVPVEIFAHLYDCILRRGGGKEFCSAAESAAVVGDFEYVGFEGLRGGGKRALLRFADIPGQEQGVIRAAHAYYEGVVIVVCPGGSCSARRLRRPAEPRRRRGGFPRRRR